ERKKREELKKAGKKVPPLKRKKENDGRPAEVKKINILNLKIRQEDKADLLKESGIYPSYHMSQKTWISVKLDDTLPDDQIMELINHSFTLTGKGGNKHQRPDGRKVWIVPANPKYYDIVTVFSNTDETIWKQGKGIETGDIVYMYVAVPYSAILYRCTVTQAYSATEGNMDLMDIHIDERYDKDMCTLEKMKKFHVTTVRGPRFMPEELERFIQEEIR
ncbi:MAG: MmcQ/YjbR family DNA-binding protein, partial [Lachnospiraceae bacterium]|nr:MmcQ/YjbR family DNA-binding protein [Lachnospiraceae bacterium]